MCISLLLHSLYVLASSFHRFHSVVRHHPRAETHTVKDTHKKQNNTLIIQKKEVVLNNKAILDLFYTS